MPEAEELLEEEQVGLLEQVLVWLPEEEQV